MVFRMFVAPRMCCNRSISWKWNPNPVHLRNRYVYKNIDFQAIKCEFSWVEFWLRSVPTETDTSSSYSLPLQTARPAFQCIFGLTLNTVFVFHVMLQQALLLILLIGATQASVRIPDWCLSRDLGRSGFRGSFFLFFLRHQTAIKRVNYLYNFDLLFPESSRTVIRNFRPASHISCK